uniref:YCII-related domain-containing protein n=1 Tax=Peronospora matthiolae TaxID=2874970 RepID=A0AAV1V152_9STRA
MSTRHLRHVATRSSQQLSRAMLSTAAEKKFYILQYEYVQDIADRRGPFRAEHLERAGKAKQNGHIVMGGALVNPLDAGVFIFNVADKNVVDKFVKEDPYVVNELVTSHSIREWMVVV